MSRARRAILAVALVAAAVLVAIPVTRRAGSSGPLTLAGAWPQARVGSLPAAAPEGPAYQPLFVLDGQTSVGTAPTPDGTRQRLLLISGDGPPRELRSLPISVDPTFGAVTADGDLLAWAETTNDASGQAGTRLYAVNWRSAGAPRLLTGDTGAVVFFNSQYDLVIAEDRLHWVSVSPSEERFTEMRSVPLAGGAVTVRTEPGEWAWSAWPWLVSAASGQDGPGAAAGVTGEVQLRDIQQRKRFTVPAGATELVTCSPVWCRVQVLSADGPARLDLMRPDGGDRRQMAGPAETAAVTDVALLDRFEPLTRVGAQGAAVSNQELLLYDAKRRQTVAIASGVGTVVARAGILWWSTGDLETTAWHTLDLRELS